MNQNLPCRVFAAVPSNKSPSKENENPLGLEARDVQRRGLGNPVRELQVTGVAEVSSPADRASVRVNVSNNKESVNEVTGSVTRRLEYILQSLRQHGIRDEDTSVRKFLHRESDTYSMDAELTVIFSDFEKMEQICSVWLEKLDKSVHVGTPQFFHSPDCLNQMRQRVCVSAVENAQAKASKISQLLGQSLEHPLLVREEETKEWRSEEEAGAAGAGSATLPNIPHIPTITAFSQVSVSFRFRDRNRKKVIY